MNGAASATPAAAVAPSPVPQRKGVLPASRPRGESLLMNSPRPTTTAANATVASAPVAAAPSKVVEPAQASPPPRGPKMLPVKQLPPASAVPSKAVPLGGSGATQPPTTLGAMPKTAPPPGASSPPKTLPPKMLSGLPNAGPSKVAASPAPVKTLPPRKLLPTKTSPAPAPAAAAAYPQQPEATSADDAPYSRNNHFQRDDDDFLQDFTDPVTPLNHPQPPPSSHYSAHQFGNIAWQESTAQRYREELEDRNHYETVIRSQRERIEALETALDRSERDREEVYARLDATIDVLAIANEERIALLYGGHLHDAPAGANTSGGINRSPRQAGGVLASQRGLTVATPAGPRQVQPPAVLPPKARPTTPPPATAVVTKFVPPSSAARADPSPIRVVSLSEPLELDKTPRERRCVVGVFQITGVNFALYEFARKSGYPAVAEFERFLRDDVVTMVNEAVPHAAETLLTSIAVGAGQVRTIHVAYPATASFNPELRPLISDADWPIRVDVTVRGFATEQDVATVAARMEAYSKLTSALRGAMVFGKLSFPQVLSNGVKEPRVDNTCCSVSIIGQVLEPPAPATVPPPSHGNGNNSTTPHQTRPATPASSSVTVDASSMTHNDEATSATEVRAVKTRAEHMTVSPKPASTVPLAETEAEAKAKRQPVSTLVKVTVCFKTLLFSRYSHDVALRRDIMDAFVNDLRDGGADEQDWLAVDASFGALNAGVGSMLAVTLCATAALGSYSERGQAAEALAQMIRGYIAKQSFSRVNGVNQMSGPRSNNRLEVAPLAIDLSRSTVNGVALADKDVLPPRPDATHASSPPPRHAASAPGSATRGPVELRNAVEFIDIDNASPWGNQRTPSATAHSNTNNEAGYYSSTSQQQRSRQVSATHRTRQEDEEEAPTTYTTYTTPNTQHSQQQSRQNSDQVQRTLSTGRQQPQQTQRRRPVSQAPDVTVRVTYVLPAFNYERFVESNSRVIEEAIEQDAMALAEPFVAGRDAVRVYFADGASSSRADYADALAVVVDNDMVRGDVAAFTAAVDEHFGQLQTLGSLRRFASVGAREPLVPRGGWTYSSYYVDDAVESSASPPRDREEGAAVITVVVSLDEADWYSYEDASRRDPNLGDALSRASSRDLFDALGSGALVPEDHIRTSVVMRQGLTAIKGTITLPTGVSRDTAVKRLEAYFGQESAMLKAKLVLVRHLDVDMRYGVPADAVNIFDGDS